MAKYKTRTIRLSRDVEEKHIGKAPTFDGGLTEDEMSRRIRDGLRHYGYFYSTKDGMKWVTKWLKNSRKFTKNGLAEYAAAPEWKTSMTVCSLARMVNEGAELPSKNVAWLVERTDAIRAEGKIILKNQKVVAVKSTGHRITIQDRLRTKADRIIGEVDSQIDTFFTGSQKSVIKFDFYKYMRIEGYPANQAKRVEIAFGDLRDDLTEIVTVKNPDADLVEGYGNLTKAQAKRLLAFIEKVIADAGMYREEVKVLRKPRAKKAVPADKIVAKLKFKLKDEKLNLVSVKPTDVLGAQVLWVFNTKTRKLGKFVAAGGETLSVKGASIIDFDSTKSVQKTVRKPEVTLKGFTKLGKIKLRRFLEEIKAVDTKLRARINRDTILLKVQ